MISFNSMRSNKNLLPVCLISLCLLNLAHSVPSSMGSEKFNDNYSFDWSIETKSGVELMTLKITAKAKGWVAFGIPEQTSGSMPGSDIMLFEYNNGAPTVTDMNVLGFVKPIADCTSNWILISSEKKSDGTMYV
jgi:hypothetical protein